MITIHLMGIHGLLMERMWEFDFGFVCICNMHRTKPVIHPSPHYFIIFFFLFYYLEYNQTQNKKI